MWLEIYGVGAGLGVGLGQCEWTVMGHVIRTVPLVVHITVDYGIVGSHWLAQENLKISNVEVITTSDSCFCYQIRGKEKENIKEWRISLGG